MEALQSQHERLDGHFERLSLERQAREGGHPIFALEHGLDDAAVVEVQRAVQRSLRAGGPSYRWWLPYVVYAAEVGYRYTGDEYWHTFERSTPGWIDRGDRDYIRQRFQSFADRFGGARPVGAWARHFSIICWPISHAVLPTDLQIQLARLLYEYRYLLTAELLASPNDLGATLAARTWRSSARFKNFAQNTELLGQVAAALLLDEEGPNALILDSTLARIVADLSQQREARRWLSDAKRTALRVDLRGLSRSPGGAARQGARIRAGATERLLKVTDPKLVASVTSDAGWAISVGLPDLTPLAARFPDLQEVLRSSRCRLAGVKRPLARGQVMYSDQQFRLETWPGSDTPLISLERADARFDAHLASECRMPLGPAWVFRIDDEGLGRENRGKTIRPGRRYLVVSDAPAGLPVWATRTPIACDGLYGYEFEVPSPLDLSHVEVLQGLGVTLVTDVEVRPVGLVPAAWDNEGMAEWMLGDVPLLALSSTRDVQRASIAIDDAEATPIAWTGSSEDDPTYVALTELDAGVHRVRVAVVPTGGESAKIEGTLFVTIREPSVRASGGTYREPFLLRSNPPLATLEEVWEGHATIEIIGPDGLAVEARFRLEGAAGTSLATKRLPNLKLPVDDRTWETVFGRQFRAASDVQKQYDAAHALILEAGHPELGSTYLRCERAFAPLRWGVGRDRRGPFVRLHDNAGAAELGVVRYDFSAPMTGVRVLLEAESKVRWDAGGLFVASVPEFETAVVLAPLVRDLADLRRLASPRVSSSHRGVDDVLELMKCSRRWATASLPGDPFAQKQRADVLRALTTALCVAIGGRRWATAEKRTAAGAGSASRDMGEALGDQPYQRALRVTLEQQEYHATSSVDERLSQFAAVLRQIGQRSGVWNNEQWAAEWLLRLASSPAAALEWCGENVREAIRLPVESPAILRAARYVVLATQLGQGDGDDPSAQWGWEWP